MNWLALLPTGIAFVGVLALAVRWVLKSSPTVAEMVDEAPDHDARYIQFGNGRVCAQCCTDEGEGHLEWCTYAPPAVVAGPDADPLERLFAAPAYQEER
jgi:hypothetical protein